MPLSVKYFHSKTHVKQMLLSQFHYASEFIKIVKEALKGSHFGWLIIS